MLRKRPSIGQAFVVGVMILTACSQDPNALLDSARKYQAEKKYNEAQIELRKAISLSPQFAEAHYQLGLTYLGLGQLGEADPGIQDGPSIYSLTMSAQESSAGRCCYWSEGSRMPLQRHR